MQSLAPVNTALRRAPLWLAFALVHAWLWWAVFAAPHTPLNDVSTVYRNWMAQALAGGGWVGIDTVWVYPSAALVPMVIAALAGLGHYSVVWLLLVVALDGVALGYLTGGGARRRDLGWWWLAFLVLLGPIAIGRIDSISVPIALVGMLFVARRPFAAGVLLGVAAWIKVWPAALVVAVVVATRRRIPVLAGALATTVFVVLAVLLLGGTWSALTGFVAQQTGRGLQLEAPVTTWWLWLEVARVPGVSTSFDPVLLTYQTAGPGTAIASMLMTPIMAVVMLAIVALGVRAVVRGAASTEVLAPLALALTAAFIVTNKVGSPQYQTWLAVPVLAGLSQAGEAAFGRRERAAVGHPGRRPAGSPVAAAVTLVVAALTQVIYPWGYDYLVLAAPWMVALVTVRNLLLVALLVVASVRLLRLGRPRESLPE